MDEKGQIDNKKTIIKNNMFPVCIIGVHVPTRG